MRQTRLLLAIAGLLVIVAAAPAQELDPVAYYQTRLAAEQAFDAGDLAAVSDLTGQLVETWSGDGEIWYGRAIAEARQDRPREAVAAWRRAYELGYRRARSARWAASMHAGLGETEAALAWLERALAARWGDRRGLAEDPSLATLHDDPRFAALVGLPGAEAVSRDEKFRRDIAVLVSEAQRLNPGPDRPAFDPAFTEQAAHLSGRVPELSDDAIFAGISRLVAGLGDGHSVVYPASELSQFRETYAPYGLETLPVQFYWFADGLFVLNAVGEAAPWIGQRVVRIGALTPEDLLDAIKPWISRDNDMGLVWRAPSQYFRSVLLLRHLGVVDDAGAVTLAVEAANGFIQEISVVGGEYAIPGKLGRPQSGEAPAWLENLDANFWARPLPAGDALFVQLNRVRDAADESIEVFAERLATELRETNATNLIIDVRHNNGGDNTLLVPLLRTVIAFETADPDHRVYVLTGRSTFSAAQSFISHMETYTNAVFAGEPSSSRPNHVGESTTVILPHTGITTRLSSRYWQDSSPGDDRTWIAPDIPVELSSTDYFTGRDPVLDAVLAVIAAGE